MALLIRPRRNPWLCQLQPQPNSRLNHFRDLLPFKQAPFAHIVFVSSHILMQTDHYNSNLFLVTSARETRPFASVVSRIAPDRV